MAPKTKSNPKGAGRKPLGKVRLVLKVEPETRKQIVADSLEFKMTFGELVDDMVKHCHGK